MAIMSSPPYTTADLAPAPPLGILYTEETPPLCSKDIQALLSAAETYVDALYRIDSPLKKFIHLFKQRDDEAIETAAELALRQRVQTVVKKVLSLSRGDVSTAGLHTRSALFETCVESLLTSPTSPYAYKLQVIAERLRPDFLEGSIRSLQTDGSLIREVKMIIDNLKKFIYNNKVLGARCCRGWSLSRLNNEVVLHISPEARELLDKGKKYFTQVDYLISLPEGTLSPEEGAIQLELLEHLKVIFLESLGRLPRELEPYKLDLLQEVATSLNSTTLEEPLREVREKLALPPTSLSTLVHLTRLHACLLDKKHTLGIVNK